MEKQRWEESEKRREEERRAEKRKNKKKEDAGARKGRRAAIHSFFPMTCVSRGSKSRLAKRRVGSHLARWEIKNCTPVWRKARFQVKIYKAHHAWTTFGSWDVKRARAVVARSTFPSQDCARNTMLGPLWRLRSISKKCKPLWREAPLEPTCTKHLCVGALLEVDISETCTQWRESAFPSQRCKKLTVSDHFWKLRCRKSAYCCSAKHMSKTKA